MAKNEGITVTGEVIKAKPNTTFDVVLENGIQIDAYLSGKLKKHFIRILPADKVEVELSIYDLKKGRITRRL